MEYFSFQWHVTDQCDQRCRHCYIFSGDPGRQLDEMTWAEMETTLQNCLDFCRTFRRRPYFYLTGGDPLLHPDFWRLLEKISALQIPFTIMGNPFHLTDAACARLKALGCQKYQMSIDGMRNTHDWFRMPGSFDLTLEKVSNLNSAGIRSILMTTVSRQNMAEIPQVMDAVVAAGVNVWAFSRYVPSGGSLDSAMSPEEYRRLLQAVDEKARAYAAAGCDTYFSRKDHLWTLYEYEQGTFIPPEIPAGMIHSGCNCGNCHLTILPTGEVYACRRVSNSRVGSVYRDSLANLWLNEMEAFRQYDRFSKCSRCRLLAYCRGCPAVAMGTNGDFYADDPQCWASEENGLLLPAGK